MAKKSKLELRHYKPRKGWSKTIGGKRHYFALGTAKNEDDEESYRQGMMEYLDLRAQLEREEVKKIEVVQRERLPNGSSVEGTMAYMDWGALAAEAAIEVPDLNQTIHGLVNVYLEDRMLQAKSGQISLSTHASDKFRLATFLSFCNWKGASKLPDVLTSDFLGEYRKTLLTAVSREEIAAESVRDRLRALRQCIYWADDQEKTRLPLPKILRKYTKIKVQEPKPVFYTQDEVRTFYDNASERTKLFILLGLNCGWTNKDISTLSRDMIDWKTGIVIRKRHKTGQPQQAKLWPITLELLKKYASDPQEPFLIMGAKGNPLLTEKIKEDGTPTKTDSIRLAFERLKKKLRITGPRGFAVFRKTGADAIAKQFQSEPHLVDLYLAHSQRGMKKHYANQYFERLFEATDWLGRHFGFVAQESGSSALRRILLGFRGLTPRPGLR